MHYRPLGKTGLKVSEIGYGAWGLGRREWIGGVAFIGLAVLYAITMARGHLDWMLVISGPLMLVGAMFLWSWRHHGELHAS